MAGADLERIHGYYVVGALRLLEEAEVRAILAAAGDREAHEAIGQVPLDSVFPKALIQRGQAAPQSPDGSGGARGHGHPDGARTQRKLM